MCLARLFSIRILMSWILQAPLLHNITISYHNIEPTNDSFIVVEYCVAWWMNDSLHARFLCHASHWRASTARRRLRSYFRIHKMVLSGTKSVYHMQNIYLIMTVAFCPRQYHFVIEKNASGFINTSSAESDSSCHRTMRILNLFQILILFILWRIGTVLILASTRQCVFVKQIRSWISTEKYCRELLLCGSACGRNEAMAQT